MLDTIVSTTWPGAVGLIIGGVIFLLMLNKLEAQARKKTLRATNRAQLLIEAMQLAYPAVFGPSQDPRVQYQAMSDGIVVQTMHMLDFRIQVHTVRTPNPYMIVSYMPEGAEVPLLNLNLYLNGAQEVSLIDQGKITAFLQACKEATIPHPLGG